MPAFRIGDEQGNIGPDVSRQLRRLKDNVDASTLEAITAQFSNVQTFTPTVTQGGAITFTTIHSSFVRVGRVVTWNFFLAVTSAGTIGQRVLISLPVAPVNSAVTYSLGDGLWWNGSVRTYGGWEWIGGTAFAGFGVDGFGGDLLGVLPNVALASGHQLRGNLSYVTAP